MKLEDCCGQSPHDADCPWVRHGKPRETERPKCCKCGAKADLFYVRNLGVAGCDVCTIEVYWDDLDD